MESLLGLVFRGFGPSSSVLLGFREGAALAVSINWGSLLSVLLLRALVFGVDPDVWKLPAEAGDGGADEGNVTAGLVDYLFERLMQTLGSGYGSSLPKHGPKQQLYNFP